MTLDITGGTVLIDEDDLEKVRAYKWHVSSTGYAVWRGIKDGKKQTIRMHRLIAGTPPDKITDHINRNRLDNRRSNLRICTYRENAANGCGNRVRTKYPGLPHGITFDKSRGKYMTKIPKQKRFTTLTEAMAFRGII